MPDYSLSKQCIQDEGVALTQSGTFFIYQKHS